MSIGKNTVGGRELTDIIERIERVRIEKKACTDLEAAILADAKARGFLPKIIKAQVKRRAMKPHERQEEDALLETYEFATGDAVEAPLHRIVRRMSADTTVRGQVLEALKAFCPEEGSIVLEHGGRLVRLWREKGGEAQIEDDYDPPEPMPGPAEQAARTPRRPAAPDVSADEARGLGGEAFRANAPITANPFPYGDERRQAWDEGWREASGGDGMGPR